MGVALHWDSLIVLWTLIIATVYSDKPRNVLILLADDGGFEIGAYMNKVCQTPNIDALARRAVLFDRAYTSASSCSPSRASLLTGAPSHQNGMYGLHHGVHHFNAFDNVTALPALLRAHGVYTGIIGKKHVGPRDVFRFDYEQTEENNHINTVGRNITHIKLLVRDFLRHATHNNKSFFLVVGFHDPHRCGHTQPQLGQFCERYGSGEPGFGSIPDWQPWYYQWDQVELPYYVQDTEAARRDIAAQYTAISRLDQGVGLVVAEVAAAGAAAHTLVAYASDNGPPFAGARTNLYEAGARVPLLLAAPGARRAGRASAALVSLLDLAPTALAWLRVPAPAPATRHNRIPAWQPGEPRSLLPILDEEPAPSAADAVFLSQSFHEVSMLYPVRGVCSRRYKLLHNLHHPAPFPVDQDLYVSPAFQDILNRSALKQPLPWYKTLAQYYRRPEWELYDLRADPYETRNLHGKPSLKGVESALAAQLAAWQRATADPWRCAPGGVLEGALCRDLHYDL